MKFFLSLYIGIFTTISFGMQYKPYQPLHKLAMTPDHLRQSGMEPLEKRCPFCTVSLNEHPEALGCNHVMTCEEDLPVVCDKKWMREPTKIIYWAKTSGSFDPNILQGDPIYTTVKNFNTQEEKNAFLINIHKEAAGVTGNHLALHEAAAILAGADANSNTEVINKWTYTYMPLLHCAVLNDNLKFAQFLLTQKADLNKKYVYSDPPNSPIMRIFSVTYPIDHVRSLAMARFLMESGVDWYHPQELFPNIISNAVMNDTALLLAYFIEEYGISPDRKDSHGHPPLYLVEDLITQRFYEDLESLRSIVTVLLNAKADTTLQFDGRTVLAIAQDRLSHINTHGWHHQDEMKAAYELFIELLINHK